MQGLLAGRSAIITGAAAPQSIGLATARLFAAHGARVALADMDGDGVGEAAASLGPGHLGFACDVRDAARCRAVASQARVAFGRLDVLVNSAGLVFGTALADISGEEWDAVIDTNLRGCFHMSQAVAPLMQQQHSGSIVCISSIAGQSGGGVFGRSHYAAAKAGIFGFAKALARELAADGIRANAVAPGPIDNDFTHGRMTREIKDNLAKSVPLGRLGRPEEVAGACLYLASDLSSFVTGTVLDVNGGLLIH